MGWVRCMSAQGGGGGGGSAEITFDLTLYRYNRQYQEDTEIAREVGGTGTYDVHETLMSFTAVGDITVNIVPFQLMTNTGANDGYFSLVVDGVTKYKKKLPTGSWTALTDIAPVSVLDGETLECRVGFDNLHSGCNFYFRKYQNS